MLITRNWRQRLRSWSRPLRSSRSGQVKNTHASTHTQYSLEIQEVFKVARKGEAKRFKPFRALPNRMLLWHGSRVTNYAWILSQGLRIAPPEVSRCFWGWNLFIIFNLSLGSSYWLYVYGWWQELIFGSITPDWFCANCFVQYWLVGEQAWPWPPLNQGSWQDRAWPRWHQGAGWFQGEQFWSRLIKQFSIPDSQ